MSTILDLRAKRAALWEQTKDFLETHRGENGMVEASAVEQYEKMTNDVKALGDEIKRLEAQAEMDAQFAAATTTPIKATPAKKETVKATATDAYNKAFWDYMRGRVTTEVRDALSVGGGDPVGSEGGFTVPDEFVRL